MSWGRVKPGFSRRDFTSETGAAPASLSPPAGPAACGRPSAKRRQTRRATQLTGPRTSSPFILPQTFYARPLSTFSASQGFIYHPDPWSPRAAGARDGARCVGQTAPSAFPASPPGDGRQSPYRGHRALRRRGVTEGLMPPHRASTETQRAAQYGPDRSELTLPPIIGGWSTSGARGQRRTGRPHLQLTRAAEEGPTEAEWSALRFPAARIHGTGADRRVAQHSGDRGLSPWWGRSPHRPTRNRTGPARTGPIEAHDLTREA